MKNLTNQILKLTIVTLLICSPLFASAIKSIQNGNWESASTWNTNHIPTEDDHVEIENGHTVIIDNPNLTFSNPLVVTIKGNLKFDGGKLNLAAGSSVEIRNGGKIFTDNNGNNDKVRIDGSTLWSGKDGDLSGPLTLGAAVLAVDFTTLNTKTEDNNVVLNWNVASDNVNFIYTVERSVDGETFETVEEIESNKTKAYTSTDYNVNAETLYYRIKQTHANGENNYSSIQKVSLTFEETVSVNVYPNPATTYNQVTLNIENVKTGMSVNIIDNTGRTVFSRNLTETSNFNTALDVTFESGIYVVIVADENTVERTKLVIQ